MSKFPIVHTNLRVLTIILVIRILLGQVKIHIISVYAYTRASILDCLSTRTMELAILEVSNIFIPILVFQSAKAIRKAIPVFALMKHSIWLGSRSRSMIFPMHELTYVLTAITIGQSTLAVIHAHM